MSQHAFNPAESRDRLIAGGTPFASSVADAVQQAGPYARPVSARFEARTVDAVLIDAIRVNVGPYVPAAWRENLAPAGARTVESAPTELPWIEAFLDSTPASLLAFDAMLPSDEVPPDEVQPDVLPSDASPSFPTPRGVPGLLPQVIEAMASDADNDDARAEEWPMYETGTVLRELANDLEGPPRPPEAIVIEPSLAFGFTANELASASNASGDHSAQALPMWNDDDMMDIMPITMSADAKSGAQQWAEQARSETGPSAGSEAAATILEALAKRVRDGELTIPGHNASMGEAATLAGALAALLGARQ